MPTQGNKQDVWEQAAGDADLTIELPGGVPMFFRRIKAGSFRMGSRGYDVREEPVYLVRVPEDFYLGTFVVTQEQYRVVDENCPELRTRPNPSRFKGDRCPVDEISWAEANSFCHWLTCWEGLPEGTSAARLPREAEWEYACRAGTETEYYNGDGEAALAQVGWFGENSGNETHAVDERAEAHPWGLHGMHGNVWEWCEDVSEAKAYRKRIDGWTSRAWNKEDAGRDLELWTDEDRKRNRPSRVLRGGSWADSAGDCRSAFRLWIGPDERNRDLGFRVCLVRGPASPGRGAPAETEPEAKTGPGDGSRGTRRESAGPGVEGEELPDLAGAKLPRAAGPKK